MKLNKCNIPTLLILIHLSCSTAPPPWVSSMPNDSEYWHGIGSSSLDNPNHKALAKELAMHEISSQIKIYISSEMEIVTKEYNDSVDDMMSSVMKSRVDLMLPELELVGSYSSKHISYAYYRLNKEKYYTAMKRLRMNAKNTALAYIKDSDETYNVNSFYLIQKAWQEILPFSDEPIMVNYKNEKILLYSLIKQKLDEYNQRLVINGRLENKKIRTIVDRENAISIQVIDKVLKKPINNVPIKISLPTKHVTLISDKNGIVNYNFRGLMLASSFDILFQIDQGVLLNDKSFIHGSLPMKQNIFSTTMNIVPSMVSIKSFEKNLDKIMKRKMLEPVIKKLFNNKVEFVIENPDFYIIIESNTFQKSERAGDNYPYFVYGNATISFKDAKTNEEFFNFVISDIKGADFSSQKVAGIRSYEKMETELISRLETEFRN